MSTERTTSPPGSREQRGRFTREGAPPPAQATSPAPARREALPRADMIRWGPVLAGLITTVTVLVVLTVLGLAVGVSAFEPDGLAGADTAATIWGIASGVLAFFAGGAVAAATAMYGGSGSGALQGAMVGVAAIALIMLLIGLGLGNTLGAAATNLEQFGEVVNDLQADTDEAVAAAETAFENAEAGAWGTFIGLIVAVIAATAGGIVGGMRRRDDAEVR